MKNNINQISKVSKQIIILIIMCLVLIGCQKKLEIEENTSIQELEVLTTVPIETTIKEELITTAQDIETTKQMNNQYTIVIDPGHQKYGNSTKEPIGPGATQQKAKVTSGTRGRVLGMAEYELNLQVSILLKGILVNRGYKVVMTRETNEVDLSNRERANIANELNADAFIRIHANGSEDTNKKGVMTICQTQNNPYVSSYYEKSKKLSASILDAICSNTGATKEYVWETDTMSGINWCMIPVTIVEMGYLSNAEEEQLLMEKEYQAKLAEGIANGIDEYFK